MLTKEQAGCFHSRPSKWRLGRLGQFMAWQQPGIAILAGFGWIGALTRYINKEHIKLIFLNLIFPRALSFSAEMRTKHFRKFSAEFPQKTFANDPLSELLRIPNQILTYVIIRRDPKGDGKKGTEKKQLMNRRKLSQNVLWHSITVYDVLWRFMSKEQSDRNCHKCRKLA